MWNKQDKSSQSGRLLPKISQNVKLVPGKSFTTESLSHTFHLLHVLGPGSPTSWQYDHDPNIYHINIYIVRKAPPLQQKCGSDYPSCMLNELHGKANVKQRGRVFNTIGHTRGDIPFVIIQRSLVKVLRSGQRNTAVQIPNSRQQSPRTRRALPACPWDSFPRSNICLGRGHGAFADRRYIGFACH